MAAIETGVVVELTHVQSGLCIQALVEHKGEAMDSSSSSIATLSFCRLERPYEKLRVANNKVVEWAISSAKFASFQVDLATNEEAQALITEGKGKLIHLRAVAHQKKLNQDMKLGWYLGVNEQHDGTNSIDNMIGDAGRGPASLFSLDVLSQRGMFKLDTEYTFFQAKPNSMLTKSQQLSFMRDGYLQIRDVIPIKLVNAALRRINHALGIPGSMIDGGVEGAAKLTGNISNSEDVMNMYYSSNVKSYVEALIGNGNVAPPQGAQIALRFPELGQSRDPTGTEWHTDGLRQGKWNPFTLLVGITLSDVREPLSGNFTVFPGSHRTLHSLLAKDGKLEGYQDECYKPDSVWGDGTLPDMGEPVQLLANRGDIVLAHPNLAHRGGLNFSPDIRYQVYIRLKHVDHNTLQHSNDLWSGLEGLHHLR